MNTKRYIITTLSALAITLTAGAQEMVRKAFDAIIDCKDAAIVETHTLERNPETGAKTGQCDVYKFTLPESEMKLVKDVIKAFRSDNDRAYSVNSGSTSKSSENISIAVGDGRSRNVTITSPGSDYIYSLFLAPKSEDPSGIYRYAYAMNYRNNGGKITGQLIVTYAMTLKHRQQAANTYGLQIGLQTLADLEDFEFDIAELTRATTALNQDSWFKEFMKYVQGMEYGNKYTHRTLAGKIYEHVRNIPQYTTVTDTDKATARQLITTLMQDKSNNDTIVQQLLKSSLEMLK